MVLTSLPKSVRELGHALGEGLEDVLGERFVGGFLYGAVCFPPSVVADFDGHIVVGAPFSDEDRTAVSALHDRLRGRPLGDELDVYYVTLDAAGRSDPPETQLRPGVHDDSWALHRAHVHAGRFALLHGPDPRHIVPQPTWEELDEALQDELDSLGSGDHVATAPAYAVLQLSRILYSYETRDVVVSKLQSAMWALAGLDVAWHPLLHAALAAYAQGTYAVDGDVRSFSEAMRERIASARARA